MLDQYANTVPDDLVVLDLDPKELSDKELRLVIKADWFEPRDHHHRFLILVSAKAIDYLTETLLVDVGLDEHAKLDRIASPLKRWSEEDGFYHA